MVMSVREWRVRRDQAGTLIGMIHDLPPSKRRLGREIYERWLRWEISFPEAKAMLRELARC